MRVGAALHLAQQGGHQILDGHRPLVDPGAVEAARGEVLLDGSQQAPLQALLDVGVDGVLPVMAALGIGEVENGTQDGRVARQRIERRRRPHALGAGRGQQRVAGAEVDGVVRGRALLRLARIECFHARHRWRSEAHLQSVVYRDILRSLSEGEGVSGIDPTGAPRREGTGHRPGRRAAAPRPAPLTPRSASRAARPGSSGTRAGRPPRAGAPPPSCRCAPAPR
jgi:hypothetical protein